MSLTLKAETIEEKFENGKTSKKYYTDADNKKSGTYQEFYQNGSFKIKANYVKDLLDGLYLEFAEDGKKTFEAQYTKGLKNGIVRSYEKGLIKTDELWINGILAFPKSMREISAVMANIPKLKTEFIGEWPKDFKMERFSKTVEADNIAGVQRLREYRFLCDVPYEDIAINRQYVAHNLDAVIILNKINRLDHTPQNPGLPEDVYKSGYTGTSNSNLAMGGRGMSGSDSIDMFMNDSDKSNIDRLGHRRWCINPTMQATGFGSQGQFTSMWSFDKNRANVPDYDFICFPPRGYIPTSHFKSSYAWSVSVNTSKYQTPDKANVKVTVSEWKAPKPVELKFAYQNVELSGFGINNCIIFQPDGVKVAAKTRYFVSISGLKDKDGKDAKIEYFVEFF